MAVTYFGGNEDGSGDTTTIYGNNESGGRWQNTAATGNVTEMGINIKYSGTGNVRVGIYADSSGTPGALLYDAGVIAVNGTGWFNKTGLSYAVTLNDYYWLVTLPSADLDMYGKAGTGNIYTEVSQAYGALPDPFPGGPSWSYATTRACVRAGVEAGAAATPIVKIINQ